MGKYPDFMGAALDQNKRYFLETGHASTCECKQCNTLRWFIQQTKEEPKATPLDLRREALDYTMEYVSDRNVSPRDFEKTYLCIHAFLLEGDGKSRH